MSHWMVIAVTYGLTFLALAAEVMLLVRRRRAALRQLSLLAEANRPGGSEETDDPDNGRKAGT